MPRGTVYQVGHLGERILACLVPQTLRSIVPARNALRSASTRQKRSSGKPSSILYPKP